MEDSSSVSVIEDIPDVDFDFPDNDSNEDALLYFECLSKHFLCLVKSSSNQRNGHCTMQSGFTCPNHS
jgi:hypothetical protein